jgi:hypothetical protein
MEVEGTAAASVAVAKAVVREVAGRVAMAPVESKRHLASGNSRQPGSYTRGEDRTRDVR